MPKMDLMGGEKDGWWVKISADARPDVFYAVPLLDEDRVKKTKGETAQRELAERLATLAYKYDPARSTATHFRMYRAPELDKVHQP